MSDYDNTDRTAYITLGMLFGVAAGAIVGMLVAPRSGEESREQLRMRAMTARDKAMQTRDKATEQFKHQQDKAKDRLQVAASKAADKTAELAEKAGNKTAAVADKANDAARQIQTKAETVRDNASGSTRTNV